MDIQKLETERVGGGGGGEKMRMHFAGSANPIGQEGASAMAAALTVLTSLQSLNVR
jgi:hypothetical protein